MTHGPSARRLCAIIGALLSAAACSTAARVQSAAEIVGMATRLLVDSGREAWDGSGPRPLRTSVWYPAAPGSPQGSILDSSVPFSVGPVAEDAPLSPAVVRFPLILLSHGTGGSALQMMWLGRYLAAHGFIVAALNHHGNTGAEPSPDPRGFLLYWERARDLSVALDRLLADSVFGPRIDTTRIGAAGFSLGGYTVITIAGGRFNPRQFAEFCASAQRDFTCAPQPEFPRAPELFAALQTTDSLTRQSLAHASDSYRDARVRAVFAIAPALGGGFTAQDFRDVRVPVSIVVGQGDTITPPATNARRYASLIPGATLAVLPGAVGHYAFLAECTDRGRAVVPICRDGPGVDRGAVHTQVSQMALRFFQSTLATR
jgi:predicted dienelactone hydrolase